MFVAAPQKILVLATSTGGGNWPPLAAVTVGLYQAGYSVQCFGDPGIAQDFAAAAIPVDVMQAEGTLASFLTLWRAEGSSGPSPFRAWAEACLPVVRTLVSKFRPRALLSEIFTMELARLEGRV